MDLQSTRDLWRNVKDHYEQVVNASNLLQAEIEQVTTANVQIKMVERGLTECQHGFEILVDALVHVEQGTFQPQFVSAGRIRAVLTSQQLPSGLDYPDFPFPELQRIVVPHVYAHGPFLVYVLDIPLLSSVTFYLYKILPFPFPRQDAFVFVYPLKEYIFVNSLRSQFGKMSTNELAGCFQPNALHKVCKADVPIFSYIPDVDCEMTLIHPTSNKIPESCEVRVVKLLKTYWIPLRMSNQWLYVTPEPEVLSVLCNENVKQVDILKRGRLTLQPGCKAYTSYITLYAMSTTLRNISNDFLPTVPMNFDCCLMFKETKDFSQLPLSIPLRNILSSVDDLRMASHKVDEVEKMIKNQEVKDYYRYYKYVTSWTVMMSTMIFFIVICCCCCCCCCRGCRVLWYKLWDKWSPKTCWKRTAERLCINITNVQGRQPLIRYKTLRTSSTTSLKSLPNVTIMSDDDEQEGIEQPLPISLRKKRVFR